jgi:hypothetical protein
VSSRVAIYVSGERREFFKSFKGLWQGDPSSSLLFNLVGDAPAGHVNFCKWKRGSIRDGAWLKMDLLIYNMWMTLSSSRKTMKVTSEK